MENKNNSVLLAVDLNSIKMKLILKYLSFFTMAIVLSLSVPMQAKDRMPDYLEILPVVKRAKWTGVWDYTVKDVPPEYSRGVLHVTKKRRQHMVRVALENGTLEAQNVQVKKYKLSFSISIEGQLVDVNLTMDVDTFTGESISPDGVFALQGTRRK